MENLNLVVNDLRDEIIVENVVLVKKLVNWKDNKTGESKSYYTWCLKVATKEHTVYVKIQEPSGKLKTIDELGGLTYKK